MADGGLAAGKKEAMGRRGGVLGWLWGRTWGFVRRYWYVVAIFALGVAADGASTTYFMVRDGGVEHEVHPVVRMAARVAGPVGGPLVMVVVKVVVGVMVAALLGRWGLVVLLVGAGISVWAGWYNVWGWELYEPLLLKVLP